jgi:hypothetical protein
VDGIEGSHIPPHVRADRCHQIEICRMPVSGRNAGHGAAGSLCAVRPEGGDGHGALMQPAAKATPPPCAPRGSSRRRPAPARRR